MAVAALRNLVTKIRIAGAAALRASRAPDLPSPPPPKADLENALLLKNKIESAGAKDLLSSGDLISEHCKLTEQVINQVIERLAQASRVIRGVTFKYICTGVVLGSMDHVIESYYYNTAEFVLEDLQDAVEVE